MPDEKLGFVSEALDNYCVGHSTPASTICNEIETYTRKSVEQSMMLTGPLEGAFLKFLIRLTGAKRVLEFGTYTGYSALSMAEALPSDGQVVTLDIDPKNTAIAKEFWSCSDHGKKIQLILGDAVETVRNLEGQFDLVFIDADKPGYIKYLDAALAKLSAKGVIAVDNTLFSGEVLQKSPPSENGRAIAAFNERVRTDKNLDTVLLPIRDGLYLIRKR
jgi:caffeoyl-CoA O-methyltransferase